MVKLFNTLSRSVEEFKPIRDHQVGIYSCGPTVYQYAHIGNLRAYLFADTLRRVLEFNGYGVKQVVNITDVGHLTSDQDTGEDKVEQEAKKEHKSAWDVAQFYTEAFVSDLEKLNIVLPSVMPRATNHIPEMIEMIKTLEQKGFTYTTSDGVYFDTTKLADYGKLARLNLSGQKAGARIEEGDKQHPTDFALWRISKEPRQMEWDSPWGKGFPGWHIECSVMSTKYLGQPFDIHTGGIDHIPVHHTNEIAQSEAATGKPLADYFMHSEFIVIDKDKMAKSLGNFVTLIELSEQNYDPIAYRYLVLSAHYRSKINFGLEALTAAQNALSNLRQELSGWGEPTEVNKTYEAKFRERVNNDLDTPGALAVTWELVDSDLPDGVKAATLLSFDRVLGLGLSAETEVSAKVRQLFTEYQQARNSYDYAASDKLRQQLDREGYFVRDTESGSKLYTKAS